jgi:5-formyltetrahydrofolate cyclo-ligase
MGQRLRVLLRGSLDDRVALLHDAGLLGPDTVIATTVHALQVLDEDLPAAEHDFQVDVIVTPDQIMSCQTARPRSGVRWQDLPPSYLDAIPALGALSRTQN